MLSLGMKLSWSNNDCFQIQCVKIAFVGLEHLKIFNKVKGPNVITKKIFFFRRVLFKSRSFWDKVDKLKENFPFTFKVPGYAPPSLSYGNREGCWINYKIQVAVIKSGSKNWLRKALCESFQLLFIHMKVWMPTTWKKLPRRAKSQLEA